MPKFHFAREFVSLKEGITTEIVVLKSGEGSGSVWVCTSSRTGAYGACEQDYEPLRELIYFSQWEDCKKVNLTAKADLLEEPNEFFTVQLLAVEENTLGFPNTMTVEIIDVPI